MSSTDAQWLFVCVQGHVQASKSVPVGSSHDLHIVALHDQRAVAAPDSSLLCGSCSSRICVSGDDHMAELTRRRCEDKGGAQQEPQPQSDRFCGCHFHSCARTNVSGEGWHARAELVPGDAASPDGRSGQRKEPFACICVHAGGQL